jgi:molybdenum cofactor biosynthesis enzyme MoaA
MTLVCNEIFEEVCILATGDVVCSCTDAEGFCVVGNIYHQRIYDIFRGRRYAALREAVLNSGHDSYCPPLGCACYAKNVVPPDDWNVSASSIRKIRLETISHCNLRCTACIHTRWVEQRKWSQTLARRARKILGRERNYSIDPARRLAKLSTKKVLEVILDTAEKLESLWLYNYGEPFLDRDLLEILRFARLRAPHVYLFTHTNGLAIPEKWQEAIVKEQLIDHVSFSIDGASQESYGKYRVGGDFQKAFRTMTRLAHLRNVQGHEKPHITWQYILFEWNDSPEELQRVQNLAEENGLEVQWIITHTEGRSKRLTQDSEDYLALEGIRHHSGELLAARHEAALIQQRHEMKHP